MSVRISPNLPATVVEIGNEITQAKIDEINSGTLATQTWVSGNGYISDAAYDGQIWARQYSSWTPISIPSYDIKRAIANLCASCFTSNGSTFQFTNYVAQCVAQGSKFTSGSPYLLGIGYSGSAPTYTFALTPSGANIADTGVTYTSLYGQCVCYSEDSGSSWTYADLSF